MAQDLMDHLRHSDEVDVWDITSPQEAVEVAVSVFGPDAAAEIKGRVQETSLAGQEDHYRFWVAALARLLAAGPEHRNRALQ
jgi:hypothetical protein